MTDLPNLNNETPSTGMWDNNVIGMPNKPVTAEPVPAEKKLEKPKPKKKTVQTQLQGKRKQRPLATADNPVIQAIIGARFRFPSEEQAIARLSSVRSQFPVLEDIAAFRKDGHDTNAIHTDLNITKSIVIWIRGFNVTPQEENQDFIGNFAEIKIYKLEDLTGYYTLTAEKIEMPISEHPQKRMRKQAHPNWGHYIIRGVNGKKIYQTEEDAKNDLAKLHFEFPDTSIPASEDKLHLIIYDRTAKPPVQKLVLKAKPYKDDDGIECPNGRWIIKSITKKDRPFGQTKKNEANEADDMAAALNASAARE